jgi:hypothetical protein
MAEPPASAIKVVEGLWYGDGMTFVGNTYLPLRGIFQVYTETWTNPVSGQRCSLTVQVNLTFPHLRLVRRQCGPGCRYGC